MNMTIATNRDGIQQEKCNPGDQQLTRVGKENHGFHKHDQQAIDPNSLASRTDQIMERLGPALVNAAYATSIGILLAGVVAVAVEGDRAVLGTLIVGTITGIAIDPILNSQGVDRISGNYIKFGMLIGQIASTFFKSPLTAVPATIFVGGGTAGVLSLIRG